MATKRNEPCPCGSGKKYKKCHGLAASSSWGDRISESRAAAYTGVMGKQREEFCLKYTAHKHSMIAAIEKNLRQEFLAHDASITCSKGCHHCCYLYVVATLQECEAIVYYLYHHEDALRHFLKQFSTWRENVGHNWNTFMDISRLQSLRLSHKATAEDDKAFDSAVIAYAEQDIPCPFLLDGACSIYEVRPYVCAGLVSSTPPDWCQRTHPNYRQIALLQAKMNLDYDMPYFLKLKSKVALTCLPALVNEILVRGWEFLREAQRQEKL